MITPYKSACLNINPLVPLADVPFMFWDTHEGKAAMLEALLALILTGHKPQGLKIQMCGWRNKQGFYGKRNSVKAMDSAMLSFREVVGARAGQSCHGVWIWKTAMEMDAKWYSQRGCEEVSLSNTKNNKSLSADFLLVSLYFHKAKLLPAPFLIDVLLFWSWEEHREGWLCPCCTCWIRDDKTDLVILVLHL